MRGGKKSVYEREAKNTFALTDRAKQKDPKKNPPKRIKISVSIVGGAKNTNTCNPSVLYFRENRR